VSNTHTDSEYFPSTQIAGVSMIAIYVASNELVWISERINRYGGILDMSISLSADPWIIIDVLGTTPILIDKYRTSIMRRLISMIPASISSYASSFLLLNNCFRKLSYVARINSHLIAILTIIAVNL
jgi:hypothetical protein